MDEYLTLMRNYQARIIKYIKSYISGKRVLDIGCGNGLNAYLFKKDHRAKEVVLVDVVDMRHQLAKKMKFYLTSIDSLPFEKKRFDTIFIQYVLHHLPPEIELGRTFARLSRLAEHIIVSEEIATNKTNIEKAKQYDMESNVKLNHAEISPIYRYYRDEELKEIFRRAGLKLIEEHVFQEGSENDGFLTRKLYILKTGLVVF